MNELQLQTGPYRTTFVGTEIVRESTPSEWANYGEILKRVDEAKQWAIGDWLVDGKRHYGDGLYREAAGIMEYAEQSLKQFKGLSDLFGIKFRRLNLSWGHHLEVASIKKVVTNKKGKLELSSETDHDKIQEMLQLAEKQKLSVRDLREAVKRYKRQQDEQIRLSNAPEKYSLFYADPPWLYGDKLVEGYGAAENHYPPMSISQLCALPIKDISSDSAVLFLWVTSPLLEECFAVIKAWGFNYKTSFIWDKVRHNYGHYNSVRHELLLVCTKGSYLPEKSELIDSVMSVERNDNHSEKPQEFREMIETLYPNSKKLELFARGGYDGWDTFGDEAG